MRTRVIWIVVALALTGAACSDDKDDDASSTSTSSSPGTTALGTTVITTGTTQTTSGDTSSSQVSIPPVTPPPGQPAVCSLISQEALAAAGVPAAAQSATSSDPNALLAPYDACGWASDKDVVLRLFYGRDPLEILAVARQQWPDGIDVSVGSDAFFVRVRGDRPESRTSPDENSLYVDAGAIAFSISGNLRLSQEQMMTLARDVITNL